MLVQNNRWNRFWDVAGISVFPKDIVLPRPEEMIQLTPHNLERIGEEIDNLLLSGVKLFDFYECQAGSYERAVWQKKLAVVPVKGVVRGLKTGLEIEFGRDKAERILMADFDATPLIGPVREKDGYCTGMYSISGPITGNSFLTSAYNRKHQVFVKSKLSDLRER